jgi:alpha-L-rhamnosidase
MADGPDGAGDWTGSTVRDLLDDPGTWAAVAEAAVASGTAPQGDAQAAAMVAAYLDAPAKAVAQALAPEERLPQAQELRRRIADILG